jgi:hypothetical protein
VSCEPTATTGADLLPRIHERREDARRQAELLGELEVPFLRGDIEQASRRRVGALGDLLAGEEPREEVGHEQHRVGRIGHALLAGELVERVERQELQAVAAVQLFEARHVVHGLDAGGGALVAVVEGRAEHAVAAQQRVVDGP